MGKLKDDSNFQVYGWMVTNLKLKANDLFIYAIIYSFSQNNGGDGIFNASTAYLCEWTSLSKRAVIDCLSSLTKRNLIIKLEDNSLKRKPNVYKINKNVFFATGEKSSLALVKKVHQTSEKSSPYNSTTNNISTTTTIEEQLDYVCNLYTTEITGRLCCSSIETTALIKFIDMYGVSAIENAIKIAVMRNKRSLGYIEGILKNEARVDNGTDSAVITEKEAPMVRQRKTSGRKRIFAKPAIETIEDAEAKFANETNDWD
nr:MAG TPA: Replication initiation and membrane attachment [Caudoviricetes sp.]